jgi:hypothetical protein
VARRVAGKTIKAGLLLVICLGIVAPLSAHERRNLMVDTVDIFPAVGLHEAKYPVFSI